MYSTYHTTWNTRWPVSHTGYLLRTVVMEGWISGTRRQSVYPRHTGKRKILRGRNPYWSKVVECRDEFSSYDFVLTRTFLPEKFRTFGCLRRRRKDPGSSEANGRVNRTRNKILSDCPKVIRFNFDLWSGRTAKAKIFQFSRIRVSLSSLSGCLEGGRCDLCKI